MKGNDEVYYTLNEKGREAIYAAIERNGTQAVIDYLQRGCFAWFEAVEFNATASGSHIEMPARSTVSGHTMIIDCPPSWFNANEN